MKKLVSARSIISVLLLTAIAQFVTGCASPAVSKSMVAKDVVIVKKHPYSVKIEVTGGRETSSMGASQISNKSFEEAIAESIVTSSLFNAIKSTGADYRLVVVITSIDQPVFGFDMTVKMDAGWRLIRVADNKVVWETAISSSHTATVGDAFAGVERLRLANEGAAKANIKKAMEEISGLTL